MKIRNSKAGFNEQDPGVLEGEKVVKSIKYISELSGIYADSEAAEQMNGVLAYTVYSYTEAEDNRAGGLNYGVSVLEPVRVAGECNMTRGHFHENRDCAEIYYGIEGEGLLLLMDEAGETWAEVVKKGSVHYIGGHLAHRLINTGDVQMIVGACWPTAAGHDYASVEKQPFGYRIFRREEDVVCAKQ